MKTKLPRKFEVLFWDTEFDKLKTRRDYYFIIERLLEKGNWNSVKWVFKNYSKQEIKSIILKSSNISQKTRNFWQIVLNEKTK